MRVNLRKATEESYASIVQVTWLVCRMYGKQNNLPVIKIKSGPTKL
jgi:hypothetical protein